MIDFESEIKKFEKIPETGDIEDIVYNEKMEDVADIIKEIIKAKEDNE